jgi:hypothetical protein
LEIKKAKNDKRNLEEDLKGTGGEAENAASYTTD